MVVAKVPYQAVRMISVHVGYDTGSSSGIFVSRGSIGHLGETTRVWETEILDLTFLWSVVREELC